MKARLGMMDPSQFIFRQPNCSQNNRIGVYVKEIEKGDLTVEERGMMLQTQLKTRCVEKRRTLAA